jgi:putative nucleotidyltransferase with HDIG domain
MIGIERGRDARSVAATLLLAAAVGGGAWLLAARRERRQASRLHRVLVELLLKTLTAGDPETARHSRRVADLADVLSTPLRLGTQDHATLRIAALLHDLGKMDDELFELVHSPDPLTEAEREQIHGHPRTSAEILEPLEPFHPGILRTVRAHHESWDGHGYPDGLAGEEIPLAARVISIADVFDALTQPRSYREPLEPARAIERIIASAGERFDPKIVSFLGMESVRSEWSAIVRRGREDEEGSGTSSNTPSVRAADRRGDGERFGNRTGTAAGG